jgi:hypothetical protein
MIMIRIAFLRPVKPGALFGISPQSPRGLLVASVKSPVWAPERRARCQQ